MACTADRCLPTKQLMLVTNTVNKTGYWQDKQFILKFTNKINYYSSSIKKPNNDSNTNYQPQ